jgi:hypothetical protein
MIYGVSFCFQFFLFDNVLIDIYVSMVMLILLSDIYAFSYSVDSKLNKLEKKSEWYSEWLKLFIK